MRKSDDEALDEAVLLWFQQCRARGNPVSGPLICEKADMLSKIMNPDADFKASSGWLWRWQNRHGIRELKIVGESRSCDDESVATYLPQLKKLLTDENISEEQLYNADETGLYWKCVPNTTLAQRTEEGGEKGHKVPKDRITFLLCTNASGSHKLTPYCIGKSCKPRCFHHINMASLPIVYANSRKAWMTSELFRRWFFDNFVPSVRSHQRNEGQDGRAILLLDNCPAHPPAEELVSTDGKIKVSYLPKNTTSKIQPMDGGIIATFKKIYRKELLREIILNQPDEYIKFIKSFTLKDMVYLAADAWKCVKAESVRKIWRNTLGPSFAEVVGNDEIVEQADGAGNVDIDKDIDELVADMRVLHILKDGDDSRSVVDDWLHVDDHIDVTEFLTDDDIVAEVVGSPAIEVATDDSADESDNPDTQPPTASEAAKGLDVAIAWLETQNVESVKVIQLKLLQRMAREAARKRMHQNIITDYFRKP